MPIMEKKLTYTQRENERAKRNRERTKEKIRKYRLSTISFTASTRPLPKNSRGSTQQPMDRWTKNPCPP
jgi:hypothetical protein